MGHAGNGVPRNENECQNVKKRGDRESQEQRCETTRKGLASRSSVKSTRERDGKKDTNIVEGELVELGTLEFGLDNPYRR
jgi:hypothetical protein